MELLDILLGGDDSSSNGGRNWDRSVFDTDRFSNNRSGNRVDWEDVSIGSYKGDGFEHPNHDEDEECWLIFENITKLEVIIQLKEYLWLATQSYIPLHSTKSIERYLEVQE